MEEVLLQGIMGATATEGVVAEVSLEEEDGCKEKGVEEEGDSK